jgi:hypothetical protein
MSDLGTKRPIPGRALASIVFACFSLWILRVYSQVHWLPTRFSKDGEEIFHRMLSQVGPIRLQLDIASTVLAVAALVWCVWSWRTEQRIAAVVATAFTALAMFCAVVIMI